MGNSIGFEKHNMSFNMATIDLIHLFRGFRLLICIAATNKRIRPSKIRTKIERGGRKSKVSLLMQIEYCIRLKNVLLSQYCKFRINSYCI